jgi:hypothetical protein
MHKQFQLYNVKRRDNITLFLQICVQPQSGECGIKINTLLSSYKYVYNHSQGNVVLN